MGGSQKFGQNHLVFCTKWVGVFQKSAKSHLVGTSSCIFWVGTPRLAVRCVPRNAPHRQVQRHASIPGIGQHSALTMVVDFLILADGGLQFFSLKTSEVGPFDSFFWADQRLIGGPIAKIASYVRRAVHVQSVQSPCTLRRIISADLIPFDRANKYLQTAYF